MRKIFLFLICLATACAPASIGESAGLETPTSPPNRKWMAPPVILEFYESSGGHGSIDEEVPVLVLYSNGDIFIKKYEKVGEGEYTRYTIYKASLENQEMCKFLLDIERFGFFENITKLEEAINIEKGPASNAVPTAYITVRTWKNQDIIMYSLSPDEKIDSGLESTYIFLSNYMPAQSEIYIPETIDVSLYPQEPYNEKLEVKEWTLSELKLSEIMLGTYPNEANFRLKGEIAKKLSEFIGNTWVGFVKEEGITYEIETVPHFPLQIKPEVPDGYAPFRLSYTIPYSYPMTPLKEINCN
jgi:hypothetical protein